jgi:hypothetical protein
MVIKGRQRVYLITLRVNDLISGFTSVELLYWDQAGQSVLIFEFKDSAAPNVDGASDSANGWTSFSSR